MDILPKKVLKYDDIAFEKVFRSVMGLKGKTFLVPQGPILGVIGNVY